MVLKLIEAGKPSLYIEFLQGPVKVLRHCSLVFQTKRSWEKQEPRKLFIYSWIEVKVPPKNMTSFDSRFIVCSRCINAEFWEKDAKSVVSYPLFCDVMYSLLNNAKQAWFVFGDEHENDFCIHYHFVDTLGKIIMKYLHNLLTKFFQWKYFPCGKTFTSHMFYKRIVICFQHIPIDYKQSISCQYNHN